MIHESGTAQFEINFNHGDPGPNGSDQVLVFKRIVRQVALKHGVYARPSPAADGEPTWQCDASARPVVDATQRREPRHRGGDGNIEMFRNFVGGLQKYLGDVTPLFAPNVNLFRRMRPDFSALDHLQMGHDPLVGLRADSHPATPHRKRLPGADANHNFLATRGACVATSGIRIRPRKRHGRQRLRGRARCRDTLRAGS